MEKVIENLMNELAGLWIDTLGFDKIRKGLITADLKNMCPGVVWIWDDRKIKVIDLKEK